MANNRLYIVDTRAKTKACIAKNFGGAWVLGNQHLLEQMLANAYEPMGTALLLVAENDQSDFDKYIANGDYRNINTEDTWTDNQ